MSFPPQGLAIPKEITLESLFITEKANADADVPGDGQDWVKTVTPNQRWFTDDAGNDIPVSSQLGFEIIETLGRGILLPIPFADFTETNVGSGGGSGATLIPCITGATANSSALKTLRISGFRNGSDGSFINWNKKIYIVFGLQRDASDSEGVGRIQLKAASTLGAMADKGIGIRLDNFALFGESYGSSLEAVDLSTTLVTADQYQIMVVLDPAVPSIEWFVNGVSKGTQTTAAKIPTGNSLAYFAVSVANGNSGGVNYQLVIYSPWLWGEK